MSETIDFELGELKGQMTALISTVNMLSSSFDSRVSILSSSIDTRVTAITNSIEKLEGRLRIAEADTIKLSVKMGFLGIFAGGLGSFLMNYFQKFFP